MHLVFSLESFLDDPSRKMWDRTIESDTLEIGHKVALRLGWENRRENPLLANPDRDTRFFRVVR